MLIIEIKRKLKPINLLIEEVIFLAIEVLTFDNCYSNSLYFFEHESKGIVFIAAVDGLGGYSGGAEAARICIEALNETILVHGVHFSSSQLAKYIRLKMRKNISIMQNPEKPGGACMTIAKVDVKNQYVTFSSIGDTEGIIVRKDGSLKFAMSVDVKPASKGVTRALSPRLAGIDFRESEPIKIDSGDRIFCFSDGINKKLFISDLAQNGFEAVDDYFLKIQLHLYSVRTKNVSTFSENVDVDNSSIVAFKVK